MSVPQGDSGAGVVKVEQGGDVLYGVFSFFGDAKFAFKEPVGIMDVCGYKDWIDGIIKTK